MLASRLLRVHHRRQRQMCIRDRLNVAPRVAVAQQEEEFDPIPTETSSFREKMTANTSDDDDALSYFAALANDD